MTYAERQRCSIKVVVSGGDRDHLIGRTYSSTAGMPRRKVLGLLRAPRGECLINFLRDMAQPLFGALCTVFVSPHLTLKFGNSVFGDTKLHGGLMSHSQCMLDALFCSSGGLPELRQKILARPVQTVGPKGELDYV